MKDIKIVVLASLIATFSFLIVACTSPPASEDATTFENKGWVLQSYGDPDSLTQVIADTRITAEFNRFEGKITGSAGCNSYFGGYEVDGKQLSIPGAVASTEMYCMEPEGVMDQEQEYLALLMVVDSYEIVGEKLTINCNEQVLIFTSE